MKTTFLLVLIFGGLCSGLQPGLEYLYRYSGRVATGISGIRKQLSAAGIQADVTVQVLDSSTAIFQLSHVEVGDFHDELFCDMREPLLIEYLRLDYGVELLEKPFKVKISEGEVPIVMDFMEVPEEPAWITNIRKAVVNVFRITPFGTNRDLLMQRLDVIPQLDFSASDETMAGKCISWYSIVKMPREQAAFYDRDHALEDDAQREGAAATSGRSTGAKGQKGGAKDGKTSKTSKTSSKTSKTPGRAVSSAPEINSTLWIATRTVDFDDCDYLVSMKRLVNPSLEDLITRSSVGSYIIRGGVSAMRIEEAIVEGTITVFTRIDHEDHYDTFTNQTLQLKGVREISEQLAIEYEAHPVYVWRYEADHSIDHRGVEPGFEQILTGVELTGNIVTEIKKFVVTEIERIRNWDARDSTTIQNLAKEMSRIKEGLSLLNYEQLEEIHQQFSPDPQNKIDILGDLLFETGTEASVTYFINKVLRARPDRQNRSNIRKFFISLPSTIRSPASIPKLMENVMGLLWPPAERGRGTKVLALIGFSQAVKKLCFSSERRLASWDDTCEQERVCDPSPIVDTYIPYLQQELDNEGSHHWQRFVYLYALSSLGTPHTINILKPYILGTKVQYTFFRKAAIWSLSKANMPRTAIGQIMDLLMSIFENVAEHHEVRSVAFLVMATWETNVSWWSRMALATWRDPSEKVANFISTTIKTSAQMKDGGKLQQVASQVEHLIKPPSPVSLSLSLNHYLLDFQHSSKFGQMFTFGWLASSDFVIPSDVYFSINQQMFLGFANSIQGNVKLTDQEYYLFDVMFSYFVDNKDLIDRSALDIVREMYDEIKENLGLQIPAKEAVRIIMLAVDNLPRLLNIEEEREPMHSAIYGVVELSPFPPLLRPQFNVIAESALAIPTDLGIPFITQHSLQRAFWIKNEFVPGGISLFSHKSILDISQSQKVEMKSLVPWSTKFAVGTRSENLASAHLPLQISFYGELRRQKNVQFKFSSLSESKVTVVQGHNHHSTVQYGAFPTPIHYKEEKTKNLRKYDDCQHSHKSQILPSWLGTKLEAEWEGDIEVPFSLKALFSSGGFSLFYPSMDSFEYRVVHDVQTSTTKSASFSFSYGYSERNPGQESDDLTSGQTSQGADDYDFSQVSQFSSGFDDAEFSQSSSSDLQEVGGMEQSSTGQRIAQFQERILRASGGSVRTLSLDIDLEGAEKKKYAALLSWATRKSSSRAENKVQFAWIKDVPEGSLGEAETTCLNIQMITPGFPPFFTAEDVLQDFRSSLKVSLDRGPLCDVPAGLEVQGTLEVTPLQLTRVRELLAKDCGPWPAHLPTDVITSPLYDHINIKAHWIEEFPLEMKNLSYFAYDLIRGTMFPNIQYDYTAVNADNQVEIDYAKCLETQKWTIHFTKPREVSIITNAKAPSILELIASPAQATDTIVYNFLNGRQQQACVVARDKIRTFDGVEISFQADQCWHVLAIDPLTRESTVFKPYKRFSASVEARLHDDQWEVRVLVPSDGYMLEMTKDSLKVNGEDHSKKDPRFDINFLHDGAVLTIYFITGTFLKITDEAIYFLEDSVFKNDVIGLCGDFNGEKTGEMRGPKGCLYTDPELFTASWKTPGEGCAAFALLAKKKKVQAYQEDCPRLSYIPTGVSYPQLTEKNCIIWDYDVMVDGSRRCQALTPTMRCQVGCSPVRLRKTMIEYDCQEMGEEPTRRSPKCYLRKFAQTFPGYCVTL
ncbi:LOW QUALITY PROTEIN: hemolymph clottable protein-like [Macrobrachium nipponense]|uniref:LOW QUALITY PROTEIN: hemolymph clottable protein-like n=1 Tax=Macrobrachium nipponense TaxID=159736 RepID=UPI0030C8D078